MIENTTYLIGSHGCFSIYNILYLSKTSYKHPKNIKMLYFYRKKSYICDAFNNIMIMY